MQARLREATNENKSHKASTDTQGNTPKKKAEF